jgi:hypothetical protein
MMDDEPLVSRSEVTGIFFVITDLGADVQRILELMEEELGGEDAEEDA